MSDVASSGTRSRWRAVGVLVAATVVASVALTSAPASAATLSIAAVADTHVASNAPSTSYGTITTMWVDGKPTKYAFLRFDVTGIGGRTVSRVRLRLYQNDAAPSGGRVIGMTNTSWSESITWDTRPPIDGPELATIGPVAAGTWYDIDLGPAAVTADGPVSLAITDTGEDGSQWTTRESTRKPALLVDVQGSLPVDGITEVAPVSAGSSQPTYYASNHRLGVTAGGRVLALHGLHATGIQLAWRDPGDSWATATQGAMTDGRLLSGVRTGDRPASIALGRDSNGVEHAWVVWSAAATNPASPWAVEMRRLSRLDDPGGPTVGPIVTVERAPYGNSHADIALETSGGVTRGAIVYTRRTSDTTWDLVTAWFTDLDSDTPPIHDVAVVYSSAAARVGTLVSTPGGMRLVAREASQRLRVFSHAVTAPLTTWSAGATGIGTSWKSYPSAAALSTGELVVAVENDVTNHIVSVQRFSAAGAPHPVELQTPAGYEQPSLAGDGTRVVLVMVRSSDRAIVSRELTASGWTTQDRLEIGAEAAGNGAWPNAHVSAADNRLRVLVRGPADPSSTARNAVLALHRPL